MKKLLVLFLCALALLSLSACASQYAVDSAYEQGYKAGYEEGRSDGFHSGYDEGRSDSRFSFDDYLLISREDYEYSCLVISQLYDILEENWDKKFFSIEEFYGYLSNYSLNVMDATTGEFLY